MSTHTLSPELGIADLAYYLPGPPVDIVPWAAQRKVAPELVEQLLASGCRFFHEGPESSDAELIGAAIDRLSPRAMQLLPEVSYLIHAHTEAFSMPAPPSSLLAELVLRFGLKPKLCFSVGHLACASVIGAIDWATRLMSADRNAAHALVVTSDRVFGKAAHRIRQDAGIQSDGASAILLSRTDLRCRLGPATFKNFPRLHDGPSHPENIELIGLYTWLHTKQLFEEHAERCGLALSSYGQVLPINADRHYWVQIAKAMKVPEELFFLENIRVRGHACCADFAVNLVDCGMDRLQRGEAVVACGQSNVGAYAALTLLPPSSEGAPALPSSQVTSCA